MKETQIVDVDLRQAGISTKLTHTAPVEMRQNTHFDAVQKYNYRLFNGSAFDNPSPEHHQSAQMINLNMLNVRSNVEERTAVPYKHLAAKYERAEEQAKKELARKGIHVNGGYNEEVMTERAAARVSAFNGIHFYFDHDGTSTPLDQADGALFKQIFPGSQHAEDFIERQGRESFPLAYVLFWQRALQHEEGRRLFGDAGDHVDLRREIQTFVPDATKKGHNFSIVSANFEPYVRRVWDRHNLSDHVSNFFAVTEFDINSTDKPTVIRNESCRDMDRASVVGVDGSSDLETVKVADIVAYYLTPEGSSMASRLESFKVPFFRYNERDDILGIQHRILAASRKYATKTA